MNVSLPDSEKYEGDLDHEQYLADWNHIQSLPKHLNGMLELTWRMGDTPEGCQDGSKLASVMGGYRIQDRRDKIHYWLPVATIHFSKIQRVFTIEVFIVTLNQFNKVEGREDYCSDALKHLVDEYIIASLARKGFRHVHWHDLQSRYYGKILEFSGQMTWFDRLFCIAL